MKNFKVLAGFFILTVPAVLGLVQPTAVSLPVFFKMVLVMVALFFLFPPIHEYGHFTTAKYYARRNGYSVKLEVCYKCTKCDNWAVYSEDEISSILQAGVKAVLLSAMYFAVLSALSGQGLVTLEFFVLAVVSVWSNCTIDGIRDTDYYYLKYPEKLVSEHVKTSKMKEIFSTVYVILLFIVLNILILKHLI